MEYKISEEGIESGEQRTKIPHSPYPIPHSTRRGFGLIEIILGAAILSVALFSISNFFQATLRASTITQAAIQGDYLLEEGVEAVKLFRDMSYTSNIKNMSTTTTYYFLWNSTNWATSTLNTPVDGKFERRFTLADVKRDTNNDIATTGTYDPDTKLVTVTVSWRDNMGTTTRSIQTYVTNIFNN
ncbi:MAG: hypothetical protein HZB10_00195 [Candidatus Yonathbacteria bacterium]|nr:hypothetical protein [Candidatus Yonathbacteria bacterium]